MAQNADSLSHTKWCANTIQNLLQNIDESDGITKVKATNSGGSKSQEVTVNVDGTKTTFASYVLAEGSASWRTMIVTNKRIRVNIEVKDEIVNSFASGVDKVYYQVVYNNTTVPTFSLTRTTGWTQLTLDLQNKGTLTFDSTNAPNGGDSSMLRLSETVSTTSRGNYTVNVTVTHPVFSTKTATANGVIARLHEKIVLFAPEDPYVYLTSQTIPSMIGVVASYINYDGTEVELTPKVTPETSLAKSAEAGIVPVNYSVGDDLIPARPATVVVSRILCKPPKSVKIKQRQWRFYYVKRQEKR